MKGISIVERHFEKAALALIAAAIGGFVAWDFLSPSKAKVGGKDVSVAEIGPELKRTADAIAAAQEGTEVTVAIPAVPSGTEAAIAPLDRPAASGEALPRGMPSLASSLFSRASRPVPLYHEPSFGPVKMLAPVAQSDGALKVAAGKDDALIAFLDRRPAGWEKGDANVIWATPAAEIDLVAIRAELERAQSDAKPPREKVPLHWWQQRDRAIWILDVVFEREEQQPDGSWGSPVAVESLPGIATFRGQSLPNAAAIAEVMRKNPDMQKRILQPPFPALAQGTATDPGGAQASSGESRELQTARKSLERAQEKLADVAKKLEEAGGDYADPAGGDAKKGKGKGKGKDGGDSGSGQGAGAGSGGSKGGGGMGPTGGAGAGDSNSPKNIRLRKQLMKDRDAAAADVKRLQDQIAALTKPAAGKPDPAKAADAGPERMIVWAHDLQVRPGALYRYRCRLLVANPFLGRKSELQEDQKKLDGPIGILSAPSEWSSVRIRNPREVFAVEAMPGEGASGLGLARFEVFRLDKGLWCLGREVSEVGDRVGAPGQGAGATDFTTDWYVVGVYRDLAADAEARAKGGESATERQMLVVLANAKDPSQIVVRRPSSDASSGERGVLGQRLPAGKPSANVGTPDATGGGRKG